jgi:hypothetical protein
MTDTLHYVKYTGKLFALTQDEYEKFIHRLAVAKVPEYALQGKAPVADEVFDLDEMTEERRVSAAQARDRSRKAG